MDKVFSSEKLYVAQSTISNGGRGVFARIDIQAGELIERCPVIEIEERDVIQVNQTMLVTYIYYLGEHKDTLRLALGFGSIYNHSYQPNAKYIDRSTEMYIDFVATKLIKKDEEITTNYNPERKKKTDKLWFEVE